MDDIIPGPWMTSLRMLKAAYALVEKCSCFQRVSMPEGDEAQAQARVYESLVMIGAMGSPRTDATWKQVDAVLLANFRVKFFSEAGCFFRSSEEKAIVWVQHRNLFVTIFIMSMAMARYMANLSDDTGFNHKMPSRLLTPSLLAFAEELQTYGIDKWAENHSKYWKDQEEKIAKLSPLLSPCVEL
jgi:hypothetical protein